MPTDGGNGVELRAVEYRVLGPVTVSIGGHALKLGGPRPQTVLAILLCNVNRTVPQDQLIDLVWQGEPPEAAKATLQSYIYGLRREVGADVIVRQGDGYRVDADAASYDALRFERLVTGADTLVSADPEAALADLTAAMSLWYGSPFAGLDGNPSLVAEIARLDALRLTAVEHRIDARLALGDPAGSLAELETLVREHPLRERFRAQHMVALYRSGRQAEALRAFQETRRYLGEELGIEPCAELRELEQRILAQDTDLAGPPVERRERVHGLDPQVLRGYELRDVIGTGAYGVVHRSSVASSARLASSPSWSTPTSCPCSTSGAIRAGPTW
jgi:DNA-binding SARP family transcriptional activator